MVPTHQKAHRAYMNLIAERGRNTLQFFAAETDAERDQLMYKSHALEAAVTIARATWRLAQQSYMQEIGVSI